MKEVGGRCSVCGQGFQRDEKYVVNVSSGAVAHPKCAGKERGSVVVEYAPHVPGPLKN